MSYSNLDRESHRLVYEGNLPSAGTSSTTPLAGGKKVHQWKMIILPSMLFCKRFKASPRKCTVLRMTTANNEKLTLSIIQGKPNAPNLQPAQLIMRGRQDGD